MKIIFNFMARAIYNYKEVEDEKKQKDVEEI